MFSNNLQKAFHLCYKYTNIVIVVVKYFIKKKGNISMKAPYSASDIADWFLCQMDRDSGDSITHLKLQKLIYYAQSWNLALTGNPLFDEDIQAWAHGPVVPSIYQRFRYSSWDALAAPEEFPQIDANHEGILKEILRVYGKCTAKHLEELTHSEEPWKETRGDLPMEMGSDRIIPKKLMKTFYKNMYDNATRENT